MNVEKISLTVRVPALGGTYAFLVPDHMPVREVQQLMVRILVSEYGVSAGGGECVLFDQEDGAALRPECSLAQLGVVDGAKLLMM